jgi:hypothetical protein
VCQLQVSARRRLGLVEPAELDQALRDRGEHPALPPGEPDLSGLCGRPREQLERNLSVSLVPRHVAQAAEHLGLAALQPGTTEPLKTLFEQLAGLFRILEV